VRHFGWSRVALPTADDATLTDPAVWGTSLIVENEAVHLAPFLGVLYVSNDNLFVQGCSRNHWSGNRDLCCSIGQTGPALFFSASGNPGTSESVPSSQTQPPGSAPGGSWKNRPSGVPVPMAFFLHFWDMVYFQSLVSLFAIPSADSLDPAESSPNRVISAVDVCPAACHSRTRVTAAGRK